MYVPLRQRNAEGTHVRQQLLNVEKNKSKLHDLNQCETCKWKMEMNMKLTQVLLLDLLLLLLPLRKPL